VAGAVIFSGMSIAELPQELVESAVELWESVGLTRPWNDPRADVRRALGAPASTVLADVHSGCVVATVMVGHDGHRGWVYYLAVRPELQRLGRGREMMREAERWLRRAGVPKFNLMVRADNLPAKDFYLRIGYSPSDVVVLSRTLGP